MSLVIEKLASIAQHRSRCQPVFVLRGKPVQACQVAKELLGVGANQLGLTQIHAVASRRRQHTFPALLLKLLVQCGALVAFGQHLRKNSVAKPKIRIAESLEIETLQQFGINKSAGDNNLRTLRPDSWNRRALGYGHLA